jgi:hypothetical protein
VSGFGDDKAATTYAADLSRANAFPLAPRPARAQSRLRADRALTQRRLADLTELKRNYIGYIEKGP